MGWYLSYASNGYYDINWTTGFRLLGPMGIGNNGSWLNGAANSQAAMNRPADTILIAEKHNGDVLNWSRPDGSTWASEPGTNPGNTSNFWITCVFGGPQADVASGWAPMNTPDGSRASTIPYPEGQNGAVSATHSNMGNFVFCDGHAKAMRPVATNPDPINQPQNNMWDGTRQ